MFIEFNSIYASPVLINAKQISSVYTDEKGYGVICVCGKDYYHTLETYHDIKKKIREAMINELGN